MLLRSITKHVKDQNWFAVALDFFIVVVGILIAFQITNWNEARADRRLENRYKTELINDLRKDSLDLKNVYDSEQGRVVASNYILRYALNETTPEAIIIPSGKYSKIKTTSVPINLNPVPPLNENSNLWTTINFQRGTLPNRNAFETLVSSGDLRVFGDPGIIKDLQTYHSGFAALEDTETVFFMPSNREAIRVGRRHGLSPFGTVDQNVLFDLVRADPELAAVIREQREMAVLHAQLIQGLIRSADKLIINIEESISAAPLPDKTRQRAERLRSAFGEKRTLSERLKPPKIEHSSLP